MKNLYVVFDEKVSSYGSPIIASSDGEASRMLCDASQDPNTLISRHPGDFSLYQIGTYCELSGLITAFNAPSFIVKVSTLVQK